MYITFECHKCKVSQKESPINVKTEHANFNGQTIELKYYDCPVCRARNFVQADNKFSQKLLTDCNKMIRNQMLLNSMGKSGKQSGKMKKMQIHLRKVRNTLLKELSGNQISTGEIVHFVTYEIVGDNNDETIVNKSKANDMR